MNLRVEGKLYAAEAVEDVLLRKLSKVSKYRRFFDQSRGVPFFGEAALALLNSDDLSKSQYSGIFTARFEYKSLYHQVVALKVHYHSKLSEIKIIESRVKVNLQVLESHS